MKERRNRIAEARQRLDDLEKRRKRFKALMDGVEEAMKEMEKKLKEEEK
jgi:predicted  nucleic acid-binding Zn-ribbon protein